MNFIRRHWRETLCGVLLILNLAVWFKVSSAKTSDILSVYFLDVGQGDAIFIDSPDHNQVLIDGGKNRGVLSELGKIMPFGDRKIDVVMATHPDADHIGGLPEVISQFDVGAFIESGVNVKSDLSKELSNKLMSKNVERLTAKRGMVVDLGRGVKLKILFPNQNVSNWETNDASIVAELVYGESEFLLTGDSGIKTENVLMNLNPPAGEAGKSELDTDVLKVGHHGSRTSTSLSFAQTVTPEFSIISSGKDNSYGHPHQTVLDTLKKVQSQILNTADLGTIKFKTDGKNLILK